MLARLSPVLGRHSSWIPPARKLFYRTLPTEPTGRPLWPADPGRGREPISHCLGGGLARCQYGCGTIFKLDSAEDFTVLHTFVGSTDGGSPYGGLVQDVAGNFYGTTEYGGVSGCSEYGCGSVFKLDHAENLKCSIYLLEARTAQVPGQGC